MKPSTELHDLIRSLTKSEKRFFKLHSDLQSGDKNYLRIFDTIDKQKVYDEEALKKTFAKETFIKHFPSEKNHLYKLVLKALRAYHGESSAAGILQQEIKNIEILYEKALYAEANKTLHRAKRIARDNEKLYYWTILLNWEKVLLEEAYESGEFTKDLNALVEEEQVVIDQLRNLSAYHILYSKINYVFRSGGYVRTDEEHAIVEEISEHPLIKGKNTALSSRAATICYYTQGFCYWAKRDWATSYTKFARVKEIMDTNPYLRSDLQKRYIRTQEYLAQSLIELGRYAEAEKAIADLRALLNEPSFRAIDLAVQIFKAGNLAEMRLYGRTGEFDKAMAMVPTLLDGMEGLGSRLRKEYELEFYYELARSHFGAGEVNKALFWLNKVLNDPEPTLRQDIFIYARLFNLVVHYDLGNNDLLEYIVRSTHRFLSKRDRAHDVETLLIEHVKRLARAHDGSTQQRNELFVSLRDKLVELLKDPNAGTVLKYFDFLAWVEGKIQNVPFAEMVRQRSTVQLD